MKTKKIVSIILAVTLVMSSGFIVTPAKEATAASVTPIGEIKAGETKTFTHPGGGITMKFWGYSLDNCVPIEFKTDAGDNVYSFKYSRSGYPLPNYSQMMVCERDGDSYNVIEVATIVKDLILASTSRKYTDVFNGNVEQVKNAAILEPEKTYYLFVPYCEENATSITLTVSKQPMTIKPQTIKIKKTKFKFKKKDLKKKDVYFDITPSCDGYSAYNSDSKMEKWTITTTPKKGAKYIKKEDLSRCGDGSFRLLKNAPKGTYKFKFTIQNYIWWEEKNLTDGVPECVLHTKASKTVTVKVV